jgi:TPR repeat protein
MNDPRVEKATDVYRASMDMAAALEASGLPVDLAAEQDKLREALNDMGELRDRIRNLAAALAASEKAITNASYCLDPNQGEPPDPVEAYKWLRTTYPKDHPNYVDPSTLRPGFSDG